MKFMKFTAFQLKIIAVIGMILQHTAIVISFSAEIPTSLHIFMFMSGGITFPIMAYLLTEGYRHTRNTRITRHTMHIMHIMHIGHKSISRYINRLFIFGIISQLPFMLTFSHVFSFRLNIMFTLALGLIILTLYDKFSKRVILLCYVFTLILIISSIFFDWGLFGLPMILMYHIIKTERNRRIIPPLIIGGLYIIIETFTILTTLTALPTLQILPILPLLSDSINEVQSFDISSFAFAIGICISTLFLHRFTGERGHTTSAAKWSFYIIYPVHLMILGLIIYI